MKPRTTTKELNPATLNTKKRKVLSSVEQARREMDRARQILDQMPGAKTYAKKVALDNFRSAQRTYRSARNAQLKLERGEGKTKPKSY